MPNILWGCDFCNLSFLSNEEKLEHQKVCPNNPNLTKKERFDNIIISNKKCLKQKEK